jgi:hypothetical protein
MVLQRRSHLTRAYGGNTTSETGDDVRTPFIFLSATTWTARTGKGSSSPL